MVIWYAECGVLSFAPKSMLHCCGLRDSFGFCILYNGFPGVLSLVEGEEEDWSVESRR